MFSYLFWRLAFERAVKTFAQTLVALFSAGGIGLIEAPWSHALSIAGMAALLSVLSSVASERVGEPQNPSLIGSGSAAPQAQPIPAAEPAPSAEPKASVPA